MIMEIGIVAGDIWHYLDENGSADIKELTKGIGKEKDLILMGLGWLAREGHVDVERSKGYRVNLKQKKA